jgi:aminopeptidase N
MGKVSLILFGFLLIAGIVYADGPQPGADGIGDPYYPDLGNGGYDAQHYTLDLTPDLAANWLDAEVTIEAISTQELSAFSLDFRGFTIAAVTVNGAPATFERRERELTIAPAAPLPTGATFDVTIRYSGAPDEVYSRITPERAGWIPYEGGVFAMSNPDGAEAWFPVNNHPADKATYTIRVTVPEPYVAVAVGLPTETIRGDDGRATYVWEASDPVGCQVTTVAIGKFVSETIETPDGIPIRYYYPAAIEEMFQGRFALVPEMLAFLETVLGPYPFPAYGITAGAHDTAHEAQMMQLYDPEHICADFPPEEYIAHEMAHQWFGNSLSVARWQDVWLGEGFAGYGAWLWLEHVYGPDEFHRMIYQRYYRAAHPPYPMPPGRPSPDDLFYWNDFRYFYDRGVLALHALRLRMGDEAFFATLQAFTARYQYGNVTIEDFIAIAEEFSGEDLTEFFDGWLYADDMPAIREMNLG